MYEKFGSYSLWGSSGNFLAGSPKGEFRMNKQTYDSMNVLLLIIP